ncbi:hypothetical protein Tsubulata_031451 [Turnera subulata]|uniref:Uncharacterized protein n=1 Tax=Turnera subulata TaxID=218843 RepID=A0A9Q0GJ59_9ROSI|nr:hypothetical protein Tsubulata_031451 [Turnera subulata]
MGLILGKVKTPSSLWDCIICDPITPEEITLSQLSNKGYILWLLLHPLTKEYKILYTCGQGDHSSCVIINLATFSRRELAQRYNCYPPPTLQSATPTIASGNLHKHQCHSYRKFYILNMESDDHPCANSVLKLNTLTESIDTVPHQGYHNCPGPNRLNLVGSFFILLFFSPWPSPFLQFKL